MPSELRAGVVLCLFLLCTGFEWPGRLSSLIYASAHGATAARIEAVQLLGQFPLDAVRDALLLALEDEALDVRLQAAAALGHLRAGEAVAPLLEWLDDKDQELRVQAVSALGEIADARALPGLARALSDSVVQVRQTAVLAIAKQAASDAGPRLIASLDDADGGIRRSAASALGDLADASAFAALANHARDESAEVRAAVLRALGRLRDARALPLLTQALRDAEQSVRLAAIAALGDSNHAAAVPLLRGMFDTDPRTARTAVIALARIDDVKAQTALIDCLAQPELSHTAASALLARARRASRESSTALQPTAALVKALSDSKSAPHTTLLADTLIELSEIAPITAAKEPLLAALQDGRGDPNSLTRALAQTQAPDVLDVLLERLARADDSSLGTVLDALSSYFAAGLGDGRASEPLLARLSITHGAARVKLVRLLGQSGAARAVPALTALLPSAGPREQLALIEAIGMLPSSGARAALLPWLDAADARLRLAAARALAAGTDVAFARELLNALRAGGHRDPGAWVLALGDTLAKLAPSADDAPLRSEALATFGRLAADPDDALAGRALDALRGLHDPRSIAAIAKLLRAPSQERRAAAVVALGDFPQDETRRLLRYILQNEAPRVAIAAALALGEVGDQRDAAALAHVAARSTWPLPAAAAYSLARMAQRGATKKHPLQHPLCELAASNDSYVRANVAVSLGTLGLEPCTGPQQLLDWLAAGQPAALRVATAHWAHALNSVNSTDGASYTRALLACSNDGDALVAQACRSEVAQSPNRHRVTLLALSSDGQSTLPNRLVAMRLPDASVFVGYTDANGQVILPAAVRGDVVSEDPSDQNGM